MLIFTTLHYTRRVRRPPIRWLESIEEDIRNTEIGIWKRMSTDEEKRKIISGAVKVGTHV
jgi:hypothetical protein